MFGSNTSGGFTFGTAPPTPQSGFTFGSVSQPKDPMDLLYAILENQKTLNRSFLPVNDLVGNMFGKAGATEKEYPVKTRAIGIFAVGQTTQLARPLVIIGFRIICFSNSPTTPITIDANAGLRFLDCPELSVNLSQSQFYGTLRNIIAIWKANGLPTNQEYQPTFMLNHPTELTSLTFNLFVETGVTVLYPANSNPTIAIEFLFPN